MATLFPASKRFEKNLPTAEDRVAILGTTGSGKSTFASWLLSEAANFDEMPWTMVDSKNDEPIATTLLENKIAREIGIDAELPTQPGVYVLRPADSEIMKMSEWLRKVLRKTNFGLWFDELYMIPEFKGAAGTGGPLKTILTQGRSKRIPVYGISQRPVDVNIHMFSEAQYIAEFRLKKDADKERVREYIPDDNRTFLDDSRLPNHFCRWYDDKHDFSARLSPCPPPKTIIETIERRVYDIEKRRKL